MVAGVVNVDGITPAVYGNIDLENEGNPLSNDAGGVEMKPMGRSISTGEVEEEYIEGGTSNIPAACFNFINSIVGAGIIGLPFAVKEAGFGLGILLLFGCGLVTDFSVRLLVGTAHKVGCKDYEALCQVAFGRAGYYAVSFFMFIFAFGAMIAYFVIIGDTITSVVGTMGGGGVLVNRNFVILFCAFFIILPLASLKVRGAPVTQFTVLS